MPPCRKDNRNYSPGSQPFKAAHLPERSAIQATAQPSLRTYDNNGNVIGYWNEDGDLVAEYAYDAFGNTIDVSGSMADFFPHRFSTKYYDAETDLYYYGYRYYSPSLGRWISRDPIEERAGSNVYSFTRNAPSVAYDYLGLSGVEHLTRMNDGIMCLPVSSLDDVSIIEDYNMKDTAGIFKIENPIVIFCGGKVDTIRLITTIFINDNYNYKESHIPGESIQYHRHSVSGSALAGGIENNPIRPSILAHEKGHGRAYFEIAKPRLETVLTKFIGRAAKNWTDRDIIQNEVRVAWEHETTRPDYLGASSKYSNDGTVQFYSEWPYLRLGSSGPGWGNYYWIRMAY